MGTFEEIPQCNTKPIKVEDLLIEGNNYPIGVQNMFTALVAINVIVFH